MADLPSSRNLTFAFGEKPFALLQNRTFCPVARTKHSAVKQRLVKFSLLGLVEENKLWERGYRCVAGLDEAGRGPLAGPVVAAAVIIKNPKSEAQNSKQFSKFKCSNVLVSEFEKFRYNRGGSGERTLPRVGKQGANEVSDRQKPRVSGEHSAERSEAYVQNITYNIFTSDLGFRILLNDIKDSKRLSQKKREKLYKIITECSLIEWGIGRVGQRVIDRINILEATKSAMKRAVKNLTKKLKDLRTEEQKGKMFLLIDGNFGFGLPLPQKSIIKGDERVFSITLASIIAKVTRDRAMLRYDEKYPQYGFAKHKGYPTKFHLEALKKYGPCPLHRISFAPVRNCLKTSRLS